MPTGRLSEAPSSMTRPKLVLRPMRTTRASATTSKHDRAQEVSGLIDRAHRTVAVPGRRTGDDHGAVGERHQRLAADRRTVAANLLGERQPHNGARLPIRQRACRPNGLHAFHQQRQVLHPRRENLGHQAPRCLQTERRLRMLRADALRPCPPTPEGLPPLDPSPRLSCCECRRNSRSRANYAPSSLSVHRPTRRDGADSKATQIHKFRLAASRHAPDESEATAYER